MNDPLRKLEYHHSLDRAVCAMLGLDEVSLDHMIEHIKESAVRQTEGCPQGEIGTMIGRSPRTVRSIQKDCAGMENPVATVLANLMEQEDAWDYLDNIVQQFELGKPFTVDEAIRALKLSTFDRGVETRLLAELQEGVHRKVLATGAKNRVPVWKVISHTFTTGDMKDPKFRRRRSAAAQDIWRVTGAFNRIDETCQLTAAGAEFLAEALRATKETVSRLGIDYLEEAERKSKKNSTPPYEGLSYVGSLFAFGPHLGGDFSKSFFRVSDPSFEESHGLLSVRALLDEHEERVFGLSHKAVVTKNFKELVDEAVEVGSGERQLYFYSWMSSRIFPVLPILNHEPKKGGENDNENNDQQ